MQWLLRQFGYYKIDYGFATGRHWIEVNGRMIAQSGDDIWLPNEHVSQLIKALS